MPTPDASHALTNALAPVRVRMRVSRVVEASPLVLGAAAGAVLVLEATRLWTHDPSWARHRPVVALAFGVVALLPTLRRATRGDAARLADEAHALDSRLLNAVHLLDERERTDFQNAAVNDALARLPIDAARAVPIRLPRGFFPALLALGMAASAAFVVLPRAHSVHRTAPRLANVELDEDIIAATRAELLPIRREANTPDVERTLTELDALLDDLANGRISREEAFRRLDSITREMSDAGRDAPSSAEESLAHVARALGTRSRELEPLTQALTQADAAAAAAAMRQLAERMRDGAIDRAELQRIREAFERLAERSDERQSEESQLQQRRDELLRQLEQERRENTEPSLLERHERELERLERQLEELERQRRELERLERELDESAEDLRRQDSQSASRDLEQAFEDLNRMANERTTQEQREALQRQIEQLREALRRQREQSGGQSESGQGQGQGQSGAMRRFVLRAGGGQGQGQRVRIVMPGQGQPGQGGGQGSGSEGESPGQDGQPGQGQGQGQGADGQGDGQGQSDELVLEMRPGGQGADAILEMPGGMGGQQRGSAGGGNEPGSSQYGTGHHPDSLTSPTDLESSGEMSRVDGAEGDGATRSQVIRGASASGFAGRGYRNVHADYADHAEEILEREDVPAGYRYYVRRYFQLIRPREETSP